MSIARIRSPEGLQLRDEAWTFIIALRPRRLQSDMKKYNKTSVPAYRLLQTVSFSEYTELLLAAF